MHEIKSERAGRNPLAALYNDTVRERLNSALHNPEAWFETLEIHNVAADATPFDLRRDMRRDHLDMQTLPTEAVEARFRGRPLFEMHVLGRKYRPIINIKRPDIRDVAAEWENARKWAQERVNADLWIGECDLGTTRRFIQPSAHGLDAALHQLGTSVCYDLRAQQARFILPDGKLLECNDRTEANLRSVLPQIFSFSRQGTSARKPPRAIPAKFQAADWRVAMDALLSWNEVDPFEQWLRKLPEWDGKERVDTWLTSCGFDFGDTDPELVRWASRSIPMLCVARAREPGCKHDTIPVLIGPQGIGKSTALAWLLPELNRMEWFNDNLRLSADEKSKVESLQGAVLVEVSEMSGATTADIESLKAFLSRASDRVRLAYRKNPEASPRRCAIVGTANGSVVLPNDPTGNRRFVALGLRAGTPNVVRQWLDANREQLWAEAHLRAGNGEKFWFPEELAEKQADANETFRSSDSILEDAVAEWLRTVPRFPGSLLEARTFTMKEIAEKTGMVKAGENAQSMPVGQTRRLGRVLHQFGCERMQQRIDGKMSRLWVVPVITQPDEREET